MCSICPFRTSLYQTSICDIFRDPHRRTDCCALACCGVLSSDRTRYLLTGKRPPPLWVRVLAYLIIPALLIAAMNYFAISIPVESKDESGESGNDQSNNGEDGQGEQQYEKVAPPELFWTFWVYIICLVVYGFVVSVWLNMHVVCINLYLCS